MPGRGQRPLPHGRGRAGTPLRVALPLAAGLSLLLVGGCDHAPPPPAGGSALPSAPRTGELLIASPPADWVETGSLETATLRMAEYGPPDEAADSVERLTFEAQPGKPLPDPIEFVLSVAHDLEERCREFQGLNISSGLENGYPTSVRLMFCPEFKDSPNGQLVMAKAIQGEEQFYVVTRRLRTAPLKDIGQPLTAQAMAEWTTHMKSVQVCDTRRPDDHPCPADAPPAPPSG